MERIELLVTVKAYPAISKKHGEAVCVAGVRTDTIVPEWVRLWPVPFRDLPFAEQFKKYQKISLEAAPSTRDRRPESRLPNIDSLSVGEFLDTRGNWKLRTPLIEQLEVESMCEIRRQQETDGTSLGMFQPLDAEMTITSAADDDTDAWQPSFFAPNKSKLEKVPYNFRYEYRCVDANCPGHHQSIIDWEIAAAFRHWRPNYGEKETLDRIRAKWVDEMFATDRHSRFFVGNMHQHPGQFLVLGNYWPKRS